MGKPYSFIPVVNKNNGQINISLKKKDLPKDIAAIIKKQPTALKEIVADRKHFKFLFTKDSDTHG